MKKKQIITLCISMSIIAILVLLFINFRLVEMDGPAMNSTIKDGQLMLTKMNVSEKNLKLYDIIILKPFGEDDMYYCKRIYGLPGDTIQIKKGKIYVNNKKIDDPYKNIDDNTYAQLGLQANTKKITLKNNEYFVLGDNRGNSHDSSSPDFGPIKSSTIKGKVIHVFK